MAEALVCKESEFLFVDKDGEILSEIFEKSVEFKDEIKIVENDAIIAQLLQLEFDQEYEETFKGTFEKSSSFNNPQRIFQNEDSEISDKEDVEDLDYFDDEANYDQVPLEEYKTQKYNSKISNKVTSTIKRSSHKQDKIKISKKDHLMIESCMNKYLAVLLNKMVNISGIAHYGKDSVIFHAYSNPSYHHSLPKECVVKVDKTILTEFAQWEKFVKEDQYIVNKFNKKITKDANQRNLQVEKDILNRLRKAEINCPRVITLKNGVLVTSFIGKKKKIAPTIKNANYSSQDEFHNAGRSCIVYCYRMYRENIICELTENNLLWHNQELYVVNATKCVDRSQELAFTYLFEYLYMVSKIFYKDYDGPLKYAKFIFGNCVGCYYDDKKGLQKIKDEFIRQKNCENN